MTPILPFFVAGLAGAFSHIYYFKKGEHHIYGSQYIKAFIGTFATGSAALRFTQGIPWIVALNTVSQIALAYLTGLYSSLLIYRIFLHPLGKFPGPFIARISSSWLPLSLKNYDLHKKLYRLHQKHGQYVRYGSSDLSITDPKAITAIYGPKSPCIKSDLYDLSVPATSLQHFRDKETHAQRRRVWSSAFSDKMIRGYEQRMRVYRQKLVDQLTSLDGGPVNIRKWLYLYGFDVMGDLAFGKSFDMLDTGEDHWAIKLVNGATDFLGLFIPIWLFILIASVPGLSSGFWRFLDFSAKRLEQRMQTKVDIPDISTPLISALKGREPNEADRNLLAGDARLIVLAGSDTTTSTLAAMLYELSRKPEEVEKLRAELAPYIDPNNANADIDGQKIANLDHLNGIINEALRLHPAVPSMLPRKTPPEGLDIDDVHVPGEITVTCPQWAMARSEAIYEKPHEFIPERWYKYPEMVKDKSAFAPFSIGPFNCIGKPVALLNLRVTLARLVTTFEFGFAPGEDGTGFVDQAKDKFVFYTGDLNMKFTRRQLGRRQTTNGN